MNRSVKKQWVEALTSGEFQQGQHLLRSGTKEGDRYCCLGVLCELAVRARVIPPPRRSDTTDRYYYGEGNEAFLPEKVVEWAGVTGNDPVVRIGVNNGLAEHNDRGVSFEEIAKAIREQL